MFDFDIPLFMFSMWITISSPGYLDSSHVSIEFQCGLCSVQFSSILIYF